MGKKIILTILLLLSGCTSMNPDTLRDITAVQLGCAPVDITISDYTTKFWGPERWSASCNGKNYVCVSRVDALKSTPEREILAATCQKINL